LIRVAQSFAYEAQLIVYYRQTTNYVLCLTTNVNDQESRINWSTGINRSRI